jgi:hypothetical protein
MHRGVDHIVGHLANIGVDYIFGVYGGRPIRSKEFPEQDNKRQIAQAPNCRRSDGGKQMTRFASVPQDDELESRNGGRALAAALPHTPEQQVPEPLTLERVVAEIIAAVRAMRTSFSERELTGDTNLAWDVELESAARPDSGLRFDLTGKAEQSSR